MFSERLKKLVAAVPEEPEKEDKSPAPPDLEMHDIRIYFTAPKPTDATTISEEPAGKEFEPNFQWASFTTLVQDLRDDNYYIYKVNLQPWGDGKGDATIIGSDSAMKPDETTEMNIGPGDVEKAFKDIVTKPDLFPYRRNPSLQVIYVNVHKSDLKNPKEGKEYSIKGFEKEFGTDFYVVLRKDRKFQNPLGGPIEGVVGKPVEKAAMIDSITIQRKKLPDGREILLEKPHGGRSTLIMKPKKGPGSYQRRKKHRGLASYIRNISYHISGEGPDGL